MSESQQESEVPTTRAGSIWTDKRLKGRNHVQVGFIGDKSGVNPSAHNNERTFTIKWSGFHGTHIYAR